MTKDGRPKRATGPEEALGDSTAGDFTAERSDAGLDTESGAELDAGSGNGSNAGSAAGPAQRSINAAAKVMRATQLNAGLRAPEVPFAGAATDSRAVQPGQLFFAIKGERVDGFDYAQQAVERGARAVVVARGRGIPAGCEQAEVLEVDDPVLALGDLARAARAAFQGRVIGITGSNGKTTTKELLAAALGAFGSVMRTPGNYNTEIGLPLTVLGASGSEDFWVLELAMRGPGQIAYLTQIARPDVACVTNIGAAHLELLGSLDAIADAKGEIFQEMPEHATAVVPVGQPRLDARVAQRPRNQVVHFGGLDQAGGDTAHARVLSVTGRGAAGSTLRLSVGLRPLVVDSALAGEHNASNAAAALAMVDALGLDVAVAAQRFATVELPAHRSAPTSIGGRILLDDCYNANPASMRAALQTVRQSSAAGAYAIVGDMLELGATAEEMHRDIGAGLAALGFDGVAGVGTLGRLVAQAARAAGLPEQVATVHADPASAARALAALTRPGDWILVKGSRGARLERAVATLSSLWQNDGHRGES